MTVLTNLDRAFIVVSLIKEQGVGGGRKQGLDPGLDEGPHRRTPIPVNQSPLVVAVTGT